MNFWNLTIVLSGLFAVASFLPIVPSQHWFFRGLRREFGHLITRTKNLLTAIPTNLETQTVQKRWA